MIGYEDFTEIEVLFRSEVRNPWPWAACNIINQQVLLLTALLKDQLQLNASILEPDILMFLHKKAI